MGHKEMKATVTGATERGKEFTVPIEFTLYPPESGTSFYGTGCYMGVELEEDSMLIDVRYEKTTDLETLARKWIDSFFGSNARKVVFQKL